MKSLYLRIYLTVVLALAAFAVVAGWVAQSHVERERERQQAAWTERAAAWGELMRNSLPEVDAARDEQAAALLAWSQRLRLPLALYDASGQAIAVAPSMLERLRRGAGGAWSGTGAADVATELQAAAQRRDVARLPLADGRVLWMARPRPRLPGPLGELRGRSAPGPGPGPGPEGRAGPGSAEPFGGGPLGRPPAGGRPGGGPDDGTGWQSWRAWWPGSGLGLVLALVVLFLAVAAGAFPVVRRLTRRLESLQRGVQRFGAGELQHRVAVDGNDEVAAVARSFNDAAQRIEELVRSHRSLLANASHELRSPLARLKMALELMETAPPDRRASLRSEIESDIRELDELVEEVLLASRLDAHQTFDVEPVDLVGLAAEEAARLEARLELTAAAQAPGALRVCGNERLLRRALRNLLENARRYGVPAGQAAADCVELRLELEGAPGPAAQVVLRVCDRGPGVPADQRERIFEPFYRLPGHAEKAGGVGLGLSLVRQIAQRHQGSVACRERAGGGACFELRLPVAAAGRD